MPLQRRLPKRGFKSHAAKYNAEITLGELQRLGAAEVDMLTLKQAKLIGEMTRRRQDDQERRAQASRSRSAAASSATAGAKAAIEAAGGSVA